MRSIFAFTALLAVVALTAGVPETAHAARKSTAGDPGKPTLGSASCQKSFNSCKDKCWSELNRCENKVSPYRLPGCVDELQRCLNRCKKNKDSCRNRTRAGSIRAMKRKSRRTTTRNTMDKRTLQKKKDRDR